MQKTFSKKRSSSSKTRKNNRRIKKMKKVVGSGTSSTARDEGINGLWQFVSVFTLFIIAIGIMGNIDKAKVPNNPLTYDKGSIHVSKEFARELIGPKRELIGPNLNLNLKLKQITDDENTLLLENTPDNIKIFKDSLKSFAQEYITDEKQLEIVNRKFDEYENLENTPDNIKIFKDSLKSFAKQYITDEKQLEIVNSKFAEYEKKIGSDDNFYMGNLKFGGKKSK